METAAAGVIVVPLLVVHRNLHFLRISLVHTTVALEVFLAVEILRIVNVRIVVKAVPVAGARLASPLLAVRSLVRRDRIGGDEATATDHSSK